MQSLPYVLLKAHVVDQEILAIGVLLVLIVMMLVFTFLPNYSYISVSCMQLSFFMINKRWLLNYFVLHDGKLTKETCAYI